MSEVVWRLYADRDELVQSVVPEVAGTIGGALKQRGKALLALAGGSTPWAIYRRLATQALDWARVTIIPGDERQVRHDDPLSNFGALNAVLGASGATIRPLEEAAILADWPPDLVWLGMGGDGHTASIFPGPDYESALGSGERVVAVRPDPLPPEAPVARLTLTCSAIRAARGIMVVVTGQDKKATLVSALRDGTSSPYPIGRVLADTASPVRIHWCP